MNKNEIGPEIYSYDNFLKQSDLDFLYNRATSASQEEWDTQYDKDMDQVAEEKGYITKEEKIEYFESNKKNKFWTNKILNINDSRISHMINDRFYAIYDRKKYYMNFPGKIQRQYVGGEPLKVHYDAIHNDKILQAIVIYINDNYEGGELFFPNHNIEIKPKAGTMITFPGTEQYEHGTKMVTGGSDRFVIACFVFAKE